MDAIRSFCRPLIAVIIVALAAGCSVSPRIMHTEAEDALGPYSGSVTAANLCFVSGKIGRRDGSFGEEVITSIDAVEKELEKIGLGLADIVSVTVYLTDIDLYGEFNTIYGSRMPKPHPARTCIAVKALPGKARVEIQVIALARRAQEPAQRSRWGS